MATFIKGRPFRPPKYFLLISLQKATTWTSAATYMLKKPYSSTLLLLRLIGTQVNWLGLALLEFMESDRIGS